MKKIVIIISLLLYAGISVLAQVGINADNSTPDPSAGLDVKFNNKGFLLPRMTFDQRNAIVNPAEGLMVFCIDCNSNGSLSIYSNGGWRSFTPCSTPFTTAGANILSPGQIIWNWTAVPGATGYKWNTINNYGSATDMGTATSMTESGISCGASYSRFVWVKNECGISSPVTLSQTISSVVPASPSPGTHTAAQTSILWSWTTVPDALGYKWNTTDNYSTASEIGAVTTKTETELTCNTSYTRYIWAYNDCNHSNSVALTKATLGCWICGNPITINHVTTGGVAPVDKAVTYGTVTNIPGEPAKCWITSNLGADHQASSADDATEASAGWYWQFNRKQGFKFEGTIITPMNAWINPINENLAWEPGNDPCLLELGLGWRIPTHAEWSNVFTTGSWTNISGGWNSDLKLHKAGVLMWNNGALVNRGGGGSLDIWSSNQNDNSNSYYLGLSNDGGGIGPSEKGYGMSLRCILSN